MKWMISLGIGLIACYSSLADCGKIQIVININGMFDRPGYQSFVRPNENPLHVPDPIDDDPNPGRPPEPSEPDTSDPSKIGDGAGTLGLFEEPRQLGFIAWNGKEQILGIRTDERTPSKGVYMSVLPLPGKPSGYRIAEGSNAIWNKSENIFLEAFAKDGLKANGAEDLGLEKEIKIGAHQLFIWKIDGFENFMDQIQAYLGKKYQGKKVVPLITPDLKKIMESYVKKGYRYFAFDLVTETGKISTKNTILYRFETPRNELYYPLVISQSGGYGNTAIDLLIISNQMNLTYPDASAKKVVDSKFSNKFAGYAKAKLSRQDMLTIDVTKSEGKTRTVGMSQLFDPSEQLYARWYCTGLSRNDEKAGNVKIRSFEDDFRLKAK